MNKINTIFLIGLPTIQYNTIQLLYSFLNNFTAYFFKLLNIIFAIKISNFNIDFQKIYYFYGLINNHKNNIKNILNKLLRILLWLYKLI